MGIILLFDIGVIILSRRSRATELQAMGLTVPEKMAIDEDTVVIGIDAEPAKRASVTDDLKDFEDGPLASSHDGLSLPPAGGDLGGG